MDMHENHTRALIALRLMIENDETAQYLTDGITRGTIHDDDENYHWLDILREAQEAYYEATGEMVANSLGVLLLKNAPEPQEDIFHLLAK